MDQSVIELIAALTPCELEQPLEAIGDDLFAAAAACWTGETKEQLQARLADISRKLDELSST